MSVTVKLQSKIDYLRKLAERDNGDLAVNATIVLDQMQEDVNYLKVLEENLCVPEDVGSEHE